MEDACIEWWRGRNGEGYGVLYIKDSLFGNSGYKNQWRAIGAHRHIWEECFGPIPDGLFVLHKCDNPGCVNPNHLFLGTHTDNMRDMVSKGRHVTRRGEDVNTAVLTQVQVDKMRKLFSDGMAIPDIANKFPCCYRNVWSIVTRRSWRSF